MAKPNWLSILIGAALVAGCSDPGGVSGSPFLTVLIDHEFNVDYGAGFKTPTVMPAASGTVDVVYGDFERGTVKHAGCASSCRDSASWTTVVIDSNGYDPAATRTAGGLHAIYLRDSTLPTQPLRYAFCAGACPPGSTWSGAAVDSTSYAVSPALAADPSGGLHVVYGDYVGKRVRYAECPGNCLSSASWASTNLAQLQNPLTVNSGEKQAAIAVDAAGTVHVVYAAHPDGLVRYMSCSTACSNPASWQTATIDSGPIFGTVSLALDAGALHLTYIAGPAGNNGQRWTVRYASCASSCMTAAAWTRGDLSTEAAWTGDQGVALAAGATGTLHLAFLLPADVAYAVCAMACTDSTHWQRTLLGRSGAQAVGLGVVASDQPSLTAVTGGSFWYATLK